MKKLLTPAPGAALAAMLAGTTGYCVPRTGVPDAPPPVQDSAAPVRLLPEAVTPYPLDDDGQADATGQ